MLFILKKKKKNVSNKRGKNHSSQTHSAPNWKGEGVEVSGSKAQSLKNFVNFLKIIFIWQQVTLKNLLSGTPDMKIQ